VGRVMGRVTLALLAVAASLAIPAATATAAGSGWSKPVTLVRSAGKTAYQPSIAIAANGTTAMVWTQYDATKNKYTLVAAIRTPRGAISKATLGPAANAFAKPALAAGADGTLAVAWEYPGSAHGDSIAVKIMQAGKRSFGALAKVSADNVSADYGGGDAPSLAVDDAGTVFVAYVGKFGAHYQVAETEKAKGARKWSSPARLSSASTDSHGARIAAAGRGYGAVTWVGLNTAVYASIEPTGQKHFGAPKQIASATYGASPPSIAAAADKAALIWEQAGSDNSHRIASLVARGGTLPSKTQYLSGKAFARYQAVALAANGSGVAAWEAEVAGGWEIDGASLGARAASWGKAARLMPAGYAATFGAIPAVAANDKRAIVGWSEKDFHRASFVGVTVRTGSHWSTAAQFPGLSAPVVAVPTNPVKSGPVAGAMIWLSTKGLQISILKP
jgi:hypothetical protein